MSCISGFKRAASELGARVVCTKAPATKAPAQRSSAPKATAPQSATPAAPAQQPRQRVVIVEPIRVFDPFFDYPYPYAYPPDYMATHFGYVKIKTDRRMAPST